MKYMSGVFRHTMDQSNRLFIPAKLREALGETIVLCLPTNRIDKCLYVYSEEDWEEIIKSCNETLEGLARTKMQRSLGVNSDVASPDKHGRVSINPYLLEKAGFKGEVVIVGALQRVEIWDSDEWDKANAREDLLEQIDSSENVFHMPL